MDTKVLQLAIESLYNEVEKLKQEVKELRVKLNAKPVLESVSAPISIPEDDTLLDTKEALSYLGICYNTFRKAVKRGVVTPIRISPRRIKYLKQEIMKYFQKTIKQKHKAAA